MTSYILRRLLFMIPTLIGITFVVFMLIALSPGGIGAAIQAVGGGGNVQSADNVAITRAKLEDRYGLNEPAIVQYGRWLARVLPIKFGQRDLVRPDGELISPPRRVPEPAVWTWVTESLPALEGPDPASITARFPADDQEARRLAFRTVQAEYADLRARFTEADARLRDELKRYIESVFPREEWGRYLDRDKLRDSRVVRLTPDTAHPAWPTIQRMATNAVAAWKAASDKRLEFIAAMRTRPFPEAGVAIIPGFLSVAAPDFGTTFSSNRPVLGEIARALPVTLLVNLIAFPIIYLIAIPSGMLAAIRKDSWADVGLGGLYVALYSVPVVLAGVVLLGFFATPQYLNWFPAAGLTDKAAETFRYLPGVGNDGSWERGYLLDMLWHVCLPVACIVYTGFAVLSKQTRAAMLENFSADYVRTAKAKGVSGRDVIFVHVFRNSLLPLITIFVTIFPAMLAGSVVVERIFSLPGMGSLLLDAIQQRDRELLLANTTIIALVNLSALLLADILYALADPRITYK
jgi:ABC-type dipeptide/oligopeptide/nickel transport system permease component